jgi:hypothetical protein
MEPEDACDAPVDTTTLPESWRAAPVPTVTPPDLLASLRAEDTATEPDALAAAPPL